MADKKHSQKLFILDDKKREQEERAGLDVPILFPEKTQEKLIYSHLCNIQEGS